MQFEMFNEVILSEKLDLGAKYGWLESFINDTKSFYANKNKIKTLSLFSGAGGLDIGFHDSGFEIIASVEVEKLFAETLSNNSGEGKYFSQSKVNCIDIRQFDFNEDIDFIIGGPPCQTFSAAGRRASGVAGTTDQRGTLFLEYVRLLKKLQPKGFLFENVYGILGAQNGEAWNDIRNAFSEVGYKLHYRIIDAADYGVPQHRERLIIVGLKEGEYLFPRPTHGPDSLNQTPHYSAEESLIDVEIDKNIKTSLGGEFGQLLNDIPPGLNYSFYTEKLGHPNPLFGWRSKFSDFLYKADNEKPVRTIKAQGGQYTGPFHWESRPFDISELKRLQTFPDSYEISGGRGKVIHQIGNSVPPQLARVLACSIKEQIFQQGTPVHLDYLKKEDELTFRKRKRQLTKTYAEKASKAIISLYKDQSNAKKKLVDSSVNFELTEKLVIQECKKGNFQGKLKNFGDELHVIINSTCETPVFSGISIKPIGTWSLPVKEVKLSWNGSSLNEYVIAWKFFEYQLRNQGIKSDLVQLGGYYQYSPRFNVKWDEGLVENNLDYKLLSKLTSLEYTRKTIEIDKLKEIFQDSNIKILDYLKYLKKLGIDIRNNNTNSMIKEGEILIPYEFPTLYGKSVQYNKEL